MGGTGHSNMGEFLDASVRMVDSGKLGGESGCKGSKGIIGVGRPNQVLHHKRALLTSLPVAAANHMVSGTQATRRQDLVLVIHSCGL